jgi:hypothetical protein
MKYEVPVDRRIELNPRFFLLVQNEAQARNISIAAAAEGLLSEVASARADQAIRQAAYDGAKELEVLKQRNEAEQKRLREIEKERELRQALGEIDLVYEAGQRSVLDRRNRYHRAWRERNRARVMEYQNRWKKKQKESGGGGRNE